MNIYKTLFWIIFAIGLGFLIVDVIDMGFPTESIFYNKSIWVDLGMIVVGFLGGFAKG